MVEPEPAAASGATGLPSKPVDSNTRSDDVPGPPKYSKEWP